MIIPSFTFLAFALVVAALFNLSVRWWWRQAVLLAANLYLVASFAQEWHQLVPYAGFIALGALGIGMRKKLGRWTAYALPLVVLLVFVWLKRYLFVPKALLLPSGYLLVGLSYVFFRVMHLVIDGFESAPGGARGLVSYLNYSLNFTSLVSGPIQRYEDYQQSESRVDPLTTAEIRPAAGRIVIGFFKVYIASAVLYSAQQGALATFGHPDAGGGPVLWGAAMMALYPIYLYFNFSGYTDFVIGVAKFFRIELPENFDRSFGSENVINFWTRWHISLSQWLKTYVYSPLMLMLMRRYPSAGAERAIAVLAYFVTFFLVGLWHGQTSEFVLFGLLTGGGVAANKLYQLEMSRRLGRARYSKLTKQYGYRALSRGLTFGWFAFTLLWFWTGWTQIAAFAHVLGVTGILQSCCLVLAFFTVGLAVWEKAASFAGSIRLWGEPLGQSKYVRAALLVEMVAIICFAAIAINSPPSQIVYKAF